MDPSFVILLASSAPGISPVDNATSSIVGYILSYGIVGICALAFAWLLLKGWRLVSPAAMQSALAGARAESRDDLIAERDRLIEEKREAERERDDAMRVLREQVTPMLINFTAATQSLLPLLQEVVRRREIG